MKMQIVIKALYGFNMMANNVEVRLPTPSNTARVKVAASVGKAKFKGEEAAVIWKCVLVRTLPVFLSSSFFPPLPCIASWPAFLPVFLFLFFLSCFRLASAQRQVAFSSVYAMPSELG